jgi:hypothetical protein
LAWQAVIQNNIKKLGQMIVKIRIVPQKFKIRLIIIAHFKEESFSAHGSELA